MNDKSKLDIKDTLIALWRLIIYFICPCYKSFLDRFDMCMSSELPLTAEIFSADDTELTVSYI